MPSPVQVPKKEGAISGRRSKVPAGRRQTLSLEIARRPGEQKTAQTESRPATPNEQKLRVGVAVAETAETPERGVVVTEVVPNSPASRVGLRRGDWIRAVGGQDIHSAQDFTRAVSEADAEDLALLGEREGRTSFVLIED